MLVIGLTGPSGAGKSTVSELFAKYGLPVINADEVYHKILVPPSYCLNALTAQFGRDILAPDGTLDRPKLSQIVFANPAALETLNSISHSFIMEEIERQLEQLRRRNVRAALLDAPQLFEAGAHRLCSAIVSVLADKSLRLERILQRDRIDPERILRRFASQKSDEYFRTHSDYIIENNGSLENLIPEVRKILWETGVISPCD